MERLLAGTATLLILVAAGCAPLRPGPDTQSRAIAANPPLLATDAAMGKDPYYGRHTVRDIWGRTSIAPGEETRHGGSTTRSLGISPPGSWNGGA
jgi:hypothetical protein